nr:hypothetical protein [Tanacetum cinerariifolium]
MVDEEIIEPVGGDSSSSSGTRDGTVKSVEDIPVDLEGALRDFYHHMSEVRVDRIIRIETTQRQLEADQMIASGERAGMVESIKILRSKNLKCAAPLSNFYPSTTSESSLGDSSERPQHSSSHSAEPSSKRCRSLTDFVPSSAPVMGSLAPTHADLLPPRKRFRDSYSPETSMEEDSKIDIIETEDGRELDIVDRDDVRDHIE